MISNIQRYVCLRKLSVLRLINYPGLTKLRLLVLILVIISGINILYLGQIHQSGKPANKTSEWREWNLRVATDNENQEKVVKEKFILGTNTPESNPGFVSRTIYKVSGYTSSLSITFKSILKWFSSELSSHKGVCPINSLADSEVTGLAPEKISCKPHRSSAEACVFAAKLYPLDSSLLTCKVKGKGDLCSVKVALIGNEVQLDELYCKTDICDPSKPIKTLHTSPDNGKEIKRTYNTLHELKRNLAKHIIAAIDDNLNYVFLKCTDLYGEEYSQLIPLPIKIVLNPQKNKLAININIVWVDSVSRAHFYRSLPNTVNAFREIRQDPSYSAHMFDFELFQSVHGHTAENELALFTGKLSEGRLGEESNHAVHMEVMFSEFKKYGYQTMWMEDLCWEALWGLSIDIGASSWSSLQKAIKKSSIDFTGLTHSSCEILHSLGVDTPFAGPTGNQVCYNGEFQDTYFLRYNYNFFQTVSKVSQSAPLFSFTSLSAGHDHLAIRTQTLDLDLAHYARLMAKDERTLTIILSDHGNTYTRYTYGVLEGQFEMFHPSMFMIIPKRVAQILGKDIVQNLQQNQKRLVTMLDLHPMLMSLAKTGQENVVSEVGIFSKIPANRTCDNVQLQTPNLCVCEGWDSPTTNDVRRRGLMEFGIGQLNNILQEQLKGKINVCQKLHALQFKNVRERSSKTDGSLITTMDVVMKAGNVVNHKEDIFHIEVQTEQSLHKESLNMVLVNYDRHSLFGTYAKCAPKGVNLKLCICSLEASGNPVLQGDSWLNSKVISDLPRMFEQNTKITPISKDSECLFVLQRIHGKDDSKGFEVVNSCKKFEFKVKIRTNVNNMKLSGKSSFTVTVKPQTSRFVFAAIKHIHYWDATFSYRAEILEKKEI